MNQDEAAQIFFDEYPELAAQLGSVTDDPAFQSDQPIISALAESMLLGLIVVIAEILSFLMKAMGKVVARV